MPPARDFTRLIAARGELARAISALLDASRRPEPWAPADHDRIFRSAQRVDAAVAELVDASRGVRS
jgi:hypothetical protein